MNQHLDNPTPGGETAPPAKQKDSLAALLQTITDEEHKQTMKEREQRRIIGERLANIIIRLTFSLLALFWGFLIALSYCSDNLEELSTLIAVMFSGTHVSVVVLYFSLIKGVFQKIGGEKTSDDSPSSVLDRMESIQDRLTKNGDGG